MDDAITVDFGRPMPVLPRPGFVLLPHAVEPLRVHERPYRQMICHCLEASTRGGGQIALATISPHGEPSEGALRLRPAVCVGQIVQHRSSPEGFTILLQGVCRARILSVIEPEGGLLYHTARLAPIERSLGAPPPLRGVREELRELIGGPQLCRMCTAKAVMEWIEREDVPTHAVLEIVGFALVRDEELRYRLLEEPSPTGRARIIRGELRRLARLVSQADRQNWRSWPRGLSWN